MFNSQYSKNAGPPQKNRTNTDPLCFFRIEELGRETTRATIHWLPPTLKYEGLKKIINTAVGGGTFEKIPHRIYVPREKESKIPHYVELMYNEESTFLLVTVPVRWTQCRHCGDTDHWTNRCTGVKPPRGLRTKSQENAKTDPKDE